MPQGGDTITYTYTDPQNFLRDIQVGLRTYTYSSSPTNPADSLVREITMPDGGTTSYGYDTINRLTDVFNKTSLGGTINRYGVYLRSGE